MTPQLFFYWKKNNVIDAFLLDIKYHWIVATSVEHVISEFDPSSNFQSELKEKWK